MASNILLDAYPHPGKYEGELNLCEKLDRLGGEGWASEELGDAESFGYYQLFLGLADDPELGNLDGIAAAILETNSQGFVTAVYYDTEAKAKEAWARLEEDYAAVSDEPEEFEVTEYKVKFCSHSGLATTLLETEDRQDARKRAARYLRYLRRQGQEIAVLDKGREWEAIDPEDAVMVSDMAGILFIRETTFSR